MGYYDDGPYCGCCKRPAAYGDLGPPARYRDGIWDVCGECYRRCDALPSDDCALRERARRAGFAA